MYEQRYNDIKTIIMDNSNFAFGKINYILLVVGMLIVISGFALMSGSGTTEEAFNPEIFSDIRIKVAPMTCLFGFIFVVVAIVWKPGHREIRYMKATDAEQETEKEA